MVIMRDIALAPYHYTRFACGEYLPGARLVMTFSESASLMEGIGSQLTRVVERLKEQTCRAQGPPEHIYVTVQEYLEVNARDPLSDSLDPLMPSSKEEAALDE